MFKWWKKYLKNLAETNKKVFPTGEKLDCCNIDSDLKRNKPKSK